MIEPSKHTSNEPYQSLNDWTIPMAYDKQPPINVLNESAIQNFSGHLDGYQNISSGSAIYPGQATPIGLIYCTLKLNGEAGELAEHVGKAMRDDGFDVFSEELTSQRRELIIKEVGDCLWYLGAICRELNITLSEAARQNLLKLLDRQNRNALQGSGDER